MKSLFTLKGDYFNGAFHQPKNTHEVIKKNCPGELTQTLWEAHVDHDHADKVIESAVEGYQTWRKLSVEERVVYLQKYQAELKLAQKEIAEAIAWETGKVLWETQTEAAGLAAKVDVTISDSLARIQNKTLESIMPNIRGHIIYKPIGPSFIIGPFNFPCHLANGQILSALLAGNSIIFKPSEKTIYSPQLMMECFHRANFPKGVINFINGTGATAQKIIQNKNVKAIYFTGSKVVGQKIIASTHQSLDKMVALELGGKNTSIFHQDAELEHGLVEMLRASYLTTGQRCTSTGIIAVHESRLAEFSEAFKKLTEKITVDHPTKYKKDPFMGALIDEAAQKAYFAYCQKAEAQGAQVLVPAKSLEVGYDGYYVSAALHLMKKFDQKASFLGEEIFGPQCTIVPYRDIDEAISIANSTEYGLAASVFTKDPNVYSRCLRDIESGLINLNRSTVGASAKLPFGGVKNSGNFKPAAVSMVDACVHMISSMETIDDKSSKIADIKGI